MNLETDPLRAARAALFNWLCSSDVLAPGGGVSGYSSEDQQGPFLYPEAAALWLTWACWRDARGDEAPPAEAQRDVATRLRADLDSGSGPGVGKEGADYLFDSVLALHALARHAAPAGNPSERRALIGLARAVLARFRDADAVVIAERGRLSTQRWSRRWGPYQVRAAAYLATTARLLDDSVLRGDAVWAATQARMATPFLEKRRGNERGARYVHAWAYAGEGQFMLGSSEEALRVAEALAALQRGDGGLPPWSVEAPGELSPARLDATAQALRLWLRVAPSKHQPQIRRGLRFLLAQQAADGSLPYEPGSPHRNTWVSLFADQALAWAVAAEGWRRGADGAHETNDQSMSSKRRVRSPEDWRIARCPTPRRRHS